MDICTIESKYGSLIIGSGQKPTLGLQPFAEYFRQLSGCIYVTEEKLFYCYNPINGLWEKQGQMDMINRISKEILQFARDNDIEDEFAECNSLLSTLQKELKAITAKITELEGKTGETTALLMQYQAEIDALEADIMVQQAIKESYDMQRSNIIAEKAD